ncbi:MAG: DUF881 domain-containing protein [Candidatus Sericytochromatia bacterium]|nr:DUF881 domain-containing protein [Candidatus Sericytochromatia bacterium]
MKKGWELPVMSITVILGALLSTQFRSQAVFARQDLPSRRSEDLLQMLKQAEAEKDALSREVTQLRELRRHPGQSAGKQPEQGMPALEGPGIEIVLTDSEKPTGKGEDPNIAIVHNDDLLRLVNELRSAGAEAISVNDQRMADSSEIACAGTTILINKSRIAPPFTVRAIGGGEGLRSALGMRGGIIEYLRFYGIQVDVKVREMLTVPAYAGSTMFRYAKPVGKQS